jgi:hypothetical protein
MRKSTSRDTVSAIDALVHIADRSGQEVYKNKREGYSSFSRSSMGMISTCIIYDNCTVQPPIYLSSRHHFILISVSRWCTRSLELCPILKVNLPLGIRQICRLTSHTERFFLRFIVSPDSTRRRLDEEEARRGGESRTKANSTVLLSPALRNGFA